VLSNIKVYRNVPSLYGGVLPTQSGTKEFAFQYGVGKIRNVTIEYEGEDIHEFGTIIADFGHPGTNENGELDFGFGEAVVRDVNIFDRTTGGSAIRCIMAPTYTADDTGEGVRARMIEIKNIKIVGGLLGSIVWMQSLGQYQPVELTIEGVQATFDSNANGAAIMEDTGAGNYDKLLATVRKFNNLGSDELAVINTGSASYNHGQWLDGGGNKNVKIDRGEWGASLPGLRKRTLANWTDAATVVRSYCGGSFEESYEIRNGQTVSLPMIGDGTFNLWVKVRGLGAVGEYKVVLNTAAITQVSAGGGVDLGSNNGTEPSLSGTELGLWHDTTADVIKAKANGANLYVTFRAFGG
jgi:hypothetical protein